MLYHENAFGKNLLVNVQNFILYKKWYEWIWIFELRIKEWRYEWLSQLWTLLDKQ